MLHKISFRNAIRSVKDYAIYMITMTIIAALMFAFNGLIFSRAVEHLIKVMGTIVILIGFASVFVVLIMMWLTKYIVNFMLERRGKEFGTYLLIGMDKKQIAKMFRQEHMLLGLITFILGIIPGYLLHVVLVNIIFSLFGEKYQFSMEFNINTYLLTLAFYVGIYVLVLLSVNKKFKRMEIRDLLYMSNENELGSEKNEKKSKIIFFVSLIYIVGFHLVIYYGLAFSPILILYILGGIASIYGLFYGLSGFLMSFIRRRGKTVNRKSNLFLLRQLSSKVRTMRTTMGTLSVLFITTILSWLCVLLFVGYQNQVLEKMFMDIDVLYFSDVVRDDFSRETKIIQKYGLIEDSNAYHIYKNQNSQGLNNYLYDNIKGVFTEKLSDNSYFEFDTYMLLSDYNYLRRLSGHEDVQLNAGSYLIQGREHLKEQFEGFAKSSEVRLGNETLNYQLLETIPFTNAGINGADYLIVVPDQYETYMNKYYSVFAADVESDLMYEMDQDLKKSSGYFKDGDLQDMNIKYGAGSDQLITVGDPIVVKESMMIEQYSSISALTFTLGYIGVVFLVVAMSILAIQQLSDASKYQYRYQILNSLGMNRRERNGIVFKQLAAYYLCPVLTSLVTTMFLGIMMSKGFISATGLTVSNIYYYLLTSALFIAIFLVYFVLTYISFVRAIDVES